jgi:hypothetical protein
VMTSSDDKACLIGGPSCICCKTGTGTLVVKSSCGKSMG